MKKRIISGILVTLLVIIIILSLFYLSIRNPLTKEQEQVVEYVQQNTDIQEVIDVSFYHGTDAFQVITGLDAEGEMWIAWYQLEDQEIVLRKQNQGLSEEEVRDFAVNELNPHKINNIRLGIENDLPVYEISYIDQENRYAYYYITFKDGIFLKRYSLRQE
jgi:uncharacterized protein YpmB